MPPLLIAVVAAVATIGGTAAAAVALGIAATSLTAVLIGAVVGSVVAMGLGMLFQGSPAKAKAATLDNSATDQKQLVRSPISPRRIIYGRQKVSGPILYAFSSGEDQSVMHLVVALAGHPIDAVETLWIDDTEVALTDIDAGQVVFGKYAGKAGFGIYLGDQVAADPSLIAESPDGWDATHILRGIAYLHVRLIYDRDIFSGIPNIAATVRGKNNIFDPRSGTTGYSINWALCILDYLTGAHGLACAGDELDADSFIAAANLSDEQVPLNADGSVTQTRYTVNGTFTLDEAPIDIMEKMLAAGAGALVYVSGQYRLHGGAYVSPSASLGPSDFAGPAELQTMPPRAELFNGVRGTFIDPARFFQASEYPQFQDPAGVAADGEEIWREVELVFVDDATRAQRLARQTLYRMRNPLTLKAPVRYAAIQFSIWQTIAVTLPDFGWAAKPFRISAFTFNPADATVTLTLTEEQVAAYAWLYDAAIGVPDNPNTTLVDPLSIPAPEWVSVTVSTALQADGTVAPALDVAWAAAANPFVLAHEVQWQVPGGEWLSRDVAMPVLFAVLEPVISGQAYNVRVRGVTGLSRGLWSALATPTAGADLTPPSVPGSLATSGVLRGVAVSWAMPPERDLAAIEVYEGANPTAGSRVLIGETRASVYLRTGLPPDTTRHYWVRARDRSGNVSPFAGPVAGTSSFLLTDDIGNAILTTAKFASNIKPIELIEDLSVDMPDGTVATNMEDGKLYTREGGVWRRTVSGLGPGGTLTSEQINDLDAAKVSGTLSNANLDASRMLGQLGSTQYAAGSVTASKLLLVPASLNPDPYFQDAGSWSATAGGWAFQTRATGNPIDQLDVPAGIVLPATFTNTGTFQVAGTSRIPVTPGQKITLRVKGKNGGNRAVFAFLAYLNGAGTYLGGSNVVTFSAGDAAQFKEVQDVVVANAATAYLVFYVAAGAAWTGTAAISDAILVKPATASMIVDGEIIAGKLGVGSVLTANLTAGAVTTEKLSVGSSNLIWNSTLTRTTDGWLGVAFGTTPPLTFGSSYNGGFGAYSLSGLGSGFLWLPTVVVPVGSGAYADWRPVAGIAGVPFSPGDVVQARAAIGTNRCAAVISVIFCNSAGAEISRLASNGTTAPGGGGLDADFAQHTLLGTAPAGTATAILRIQLVGTGGSNPILFFTKTAIGAAPPHATEVGAWAAGGVTEISGAQIRTHTVTAEQVNTDALFADAGTFNSLRAGIGSFGGLHAAEIAVGELRAYHMAAEEIISDSIQVRNLVVGTEKITGSAVTSLATVSTYNNVTQHGPDSYGYAVFGLVSVGVSIPGGTSDGRVLIVCNPNETRIATLLIDGGGGGAGGGGDGGGGGGGAE